MAKSKEPKASKADAKEISKEETGQATETQSDSSAEKDLVSEEQKLQKQLDEKNDQYLRLAAEYDNYRKRTSKEKEEIHIMSKVTILSELLPVTDDLERALNNSTDDIENYKKGVEMIAAKLIESFKKLGAESFGEVGDAFDPNLHNAVMHIEDESLGENVVAEVFNKGYKIGERIIRCAIVKVAN